MTNTFSEIFELSLFEEDANQSTSNLSIAVAAAILMYKVVKADGNTEDMEIAELIRILKSQFGLVSDEVSEILQSVHSIDDDNIELASYTSLLVKNWGPAERVRLLEDFWTIALANKDIGQNERETIDSLAMMLELTEDQIERAQINAEQKIELNIS